MNVAVVILFVRAVTDIFRWVVIASALLSFFLPPYHPVREALDRIVEPFLNPIRRVVPMAGTLDFSPLVLILLIEFVSRILISILLSVQ
ncbi:MAG: YggT family protein [Anaerolineales bacterium]